MYILFGIEHLDFNEMSRGARRAQRTLREHSCPNCRNRNLNAFMDRAPS